MSKIVKNIRSGKMNATLKGTTTRSTKPNTIISPKVVDSTIQGLNGINYTLDNLILG